MISNSGSTHHISPYHGSFTDYVDIPPKSLSAVNQSCFVAVRQGTMCIEVPNSVETSKLYLTKVLYLPEVGYTLVSIGQLNQGGYTTTFGGSVCTTHNSRDNIVGRVPQSPRGMYQASIDPTNSSNTAFDTLTPMEIYHRMGHISSSMAEKLIKNGLVTRIQIHTSPSGDTEFCESCVYAKTTQKVHEGEHATEFGGEVHSDLWGPAPVATLQGHCYYVSFTGDAT